MISLFSILFQQVVTNGQELKSSRSVAVGSTTHERQLLQKPKKNKKKTTATEHRYRQKKSLYSCLVQTKRND